MPLINKGFVPKRGKDSRLPPGQYETSDFPVLSLGPTPHIDPANWTLRIEGRGESKKWTWDEFHLLPQEEIKTDIHCVTKWSKFDTHWKGVSLDVLMKEANVQMDATDVIAHSDDGYTTNIPLADVTGGKAWVVTQYDDSPISAEHGGPARLLVPHLYFWKSAKWLAKLVFVDQDEPGFWEVRGYHNYGDPWKEQRYTFD